MMREQAVTRKYVELLRRKFRLSPDRAEDIVQAAWVRALRFQAKFEGRSEWLTWFSVIVHREAMRVFRKSPFQTVALNPDVLAVCIAEDASLAGVGQLIGKLSDAWSREIFWLHYVEGWLVEEIAESYGVSESSVKGRLRRGRMEIATRLNHRVRRAAA